MAVRFSALLSADAEQLEGMVAIFIQLPTMFWILYHVEAVRQT